MLQSLVSRVVQPVMLSILYEAMSHVGLDELAVMSPHAARQVAHCTGINN